MGEKMEKTVGMFRKLISQGAHSEKRERESTFVGGFLWIVHL